MEQKRSAGNPLGLDLDENGNASLTKSSLLKAVGGWLGIAESFLPGTAFGVAYSISLDVMLSVAVGVSISLAFLVLQITRRRPVTQALAGLVGIGISVYLVHNSGDARDYFITGFITNACYLAALSLSILLRFPIMGVLVGVLRGTGLSWRKDKALMRRYSAATTLWVALFAARLLIQLPLYFADQVGALAIAKTLMGTPLYALTVWFTWLVVRSSVRPVD
ncbi:MAG: hypothetical protein RLZ71_421 [Actinomycetota bacterium]|jgi:hypothetical protein